jgi:hypothetical protein
MPAVVSLSKMLIRARSVQSVYLLSLLPTVGTSRARIDKLDKVPTAQRTMNRAAPPHKPAEPGPDIGTGSLACPACSPISSAAAW